MPSFQYNPLLGLLVAAVLGGAIGLQRQAAQKPAGFRTHLLVATAAAAFTAIGAHLHDTRIPSYIVVGIGFLGAGAIVREGTSPHGLTTAASIWMAAAIGLAVGYHDGFGLTIGVAATILTLVALSISDRELMRAFRFTRRWTLAVDYTAPQAAAAEIERLMKESRMNFEGGEVSSIAQSDGEQLVAMQYLITATRESDVDGLVHSLAAVPGVRRVRANEPFFNG